MMTKSQAATVLDALARDTGVASLELDQSNTALIAFGDTHELIFHFLPERNGFQFWSPLHQITIGGDAEADLAMLQHILQRNFPSVSLAGSYFALDASVGVVLLGRFTAVDSTAPAAFIAATKSFAQQVIRVSNSLQNDVTAARNSMPAQELSDDEITIMRV